MRILWLYGPPAVGKSVTPWDLLNVLSEQDPAIGYVDIDQLGMTSSHEEGDPEGHVLKGRALAAVAGAFAGSGARVLIVSGVVDPGLMSFYATELESYDPLFVRLTVGLVTMVNGARSSTYVSWGSSAWTGEWSTTVIRPGQRVRCGGCSGLTVRGNSS